MSLDRFRVFLDVGFFFDFFSFLLCYLFSNLDLMNVLGLIFFFPGLFSGLQIPVYLSSRSECFCRSERKSECGGT